MSSSSESVRRSTLATLTEIVDGENRLKAQGIDVTDENEWMQLGDIVHRLMRKWGVSEKTESGE